MAIYDKSENNSVRVYYDTISFTVHTNLDYPDKDKQQTWNLIFSATKIAVSGVDYTNACKADPLEYPQLIFSVTRPIPCAYPLLRASIWNKLVAVMREEQKGNKAFKICVSGGETIDAIEEAITPIFNYINVKPKHTNTILFINKSKQQGKPKTFTIPMSRFWSQPNDTSGTLNGVNLTDDLPYGQPLYSVVRESMLNPQPAPTTPQERELATQEHNDNLEQLYPMTVRNSSGQIVDPRSIPTRYRQPRHNDLADALLAAQAMTNVPYNTNTDNTPEAHINNQFFNDQATELAHFISGQITGDQFHNRQLALTQRRDEQLSDITRFPSARQRLQTQIVQENARQRAQQSAQAMVDYTRSPQGQEEQRLRQENSNRAWQEIVRQTESGEILQNISNELDRIALQEQLYRDREDAHVATEERLRQEFEDELRNERNERSERNEN